MPEITQGDAVVYYKINRVNRKEWFFFVHGAGSNHSIYKPFFEKFNDKNFIAIDVRNHGHSHGGETSLALIVSDIKAILDKENIEEVIFVGNCLGASVALSFYYQYPKYVRKLVLITLFSARYVNLSSVFYPISSWLSSFFGLFKWKRRLKFQDYQKYEKRPVWYYPMLDVRGTPLEAYAVLVKDLFSYVIDLDSVRIPTLVITADMDAFTKNDLIVFDASRNKKITVKGVACHHVPLTRKASEVIKLVERFL